MKTRYLLTLMTAGLLAVSPNGHSVNTCTENLQTNSVSCINPGGFSTNYSLTPTNITLGIGQLFLLPTASNLTITNSRQRQLVIGHCPYSPPPYYVTNPISYLFNPVFLEPAPPLAFWTIGTNYFSAKVVTTGNPCQPRTNALGTVIVKVVDNRPDVLLNVDFTGPTHGQVSGYAAIGNGSSDFWNYCTASGQASRAVSNLVTADGLVSTVGLIITNLSFPGATGSLKPMYSDYLSTNAATGITIITNLPAGIWNFYLYSSDGNFGLNVGGVNYPVKTCLDTSVTNPFNWQEGRQYARFGNIPVTRGKAVTITVKPGVNGKSILCGMQIASTTHTPPYTLSASPMTDTDYDGVNDNQEMADRTNPNDPNSVRQLRLGYWPFDNTNTWIGSAGQLPLQTSNLIARAGWVTNAVQINRTNGAILCYRDVETNGSANINLKNGMIRFWFKPDWSSVGVGGSGPGSPGRLIEMGNFAPATSTGWWSLYFSPDGNSILFGSSVSGLSRTYLTNMIAWRSNEWHQLTLSYSPTNSMLFVDGQLVVKGNGVAYYPYPLYRSMGFRIGGDAFGTNQAKGTFDELETFNYPAAAAPPTIVTQPASQIVAEGKTATFNVVAIGTPRLSCQWFFNSTPLIGATNLTLTQTFVGTESEGNYHVVITNAYGLVTSSNANLTISFPPEITNNPDSLTVVAGSNATFTVGATGTLPLAYQWYRYGTRLFVATGPALTLSNVTASSAGSYYVVVTNIGGRMQSASALLTVDILPVIRQQPSNVLVNLGDRAMFQVSATGNPAPGYQWFFDGTAIASQNNNWYYKEHIGLDDLGTYSVAVTNEVGSVTSSIVVLATNVLPSIIVQPRNQTVNEGSNATFNVTVAGTPPFTFRWAYDGSIFSETTNSISVITDVQHGLAWRDDGMQIHAANTNEFANYMPAGEGPYSVIISNAAGSVTSSVANLTVVARPRISQITPNQALALGAQMQLEVRAVGNPPLYYQWRHAGTNLVGATNQNYTVNSLKFSDAGYYSVWVGNQVGNVISSNIQVVIPTAVVGWGDNSNNQLRVPLELTNAAAVAAGYRHSLALSAAGRIFAWGYNGSGQTNVPSGLTNIIAIAAGASNNLALKSDGTMTAWGDNSYNQTNIPADTKSIVRIACGNNHCLALNSNGIVIAWGFNDQNFHQTNVPPDLSGVIEIAAGANHCLALRTNGNVIAWGDSNSGQTNVPSDLTHVVRIAAGGNSSAAVKADGSLVVWGEISSHDRTNITATAVGAHHVVAIQRDTTLTSFGANDSGQTNTPKNLVWPAAVAAGDSHTLAIAGLAPVILGQPVDTAVPVGTTASFVVNPDGTQPFVYQWYFGAASILGATNHTLILTNVQTANNGRYHVTVANQFGSVVSSNASLLPVVAPTITRQPYNQNVRLFHDAIYTVDVSGTGPFAYQWMFNGSPIPGATLASYVVANANTGDVGNYSVVVTNLAGTAASSNAMLNVFIPPSITNTLNNITVSPGGMATWSVMTTGSQPLTYQWWFKGNYIPGATQNSYSISNAQLVNAGSYSVVVNNPGGSVQADVMLQVLSYDTATICVGSRVDNSSQPVISLLALRKGHIDATNKYAISYLTALGETAMSALATNPLPFIGSNLNWGLKINLVTNLPNVVEQRIWRSLPRSSEMRLLAKVSPATASYVDVESESDFATRMSVANAELPFENTSGGASYVPDPIAPSVCLTNDLLGSINDANQYAVSYVTSSGETALSAIVTNSTPVNNQSVFILLKTNVANVIKTRIWRNIPGTNTMKILATVYPYHNFYMDRESGEAFNERLSTASAVMPDSNTTSSATYVPAPPQPAITMVTNGTGRIFATNVYAVSYVTVDNTGRFCETATSPFATNTSSGMGQAVSIAIQTNLPNVVVKIRIWRSLFDSANLQMLAEFNPGCSSYIDEESWDDFADRLVDAVGVGGGAPATNTTGGRETFVENPPPPVVGLKTVNISSLDWPAGTNALYGYAISYLTGIGQTAVSTSLVYAPPLKNQHQSVSIVLPQVNNSSVVKKRIWRTVAAGGASTPQLRLLAELNPNATSYTDNESSSTFAARLAQQESFAVKPPTNNTSAGQSSLVLLAPPVGMGAVSFQWSSNGIPLAGATNQTYLISPNWAKNCWYSALSRDSVGNEAAKTISVTVSSGASILSIPMDVTCCQGSNLTLTLAAEGKDLRFVWAKLGGVLTNTSRIHGVSKSVLTIENSELGDSGTYMVAMTDGCDNTVNFTAKVSISGPDARPSIVVSAPSSPPLNGGHTSFGQIFPSGSSTTTNVMTYNTNLVVGIRQFIDPQAALWIIQHQWFFDLQYYAWMRQQWPFYPYPGYRYWPYNMCFFQPPWNYYWPFNHISWNYCSQPRLIWLPIIGWNCSCTSYINCQSVGKVWVPVWLTGGCNNVPIDFLIPRTVYEQITASYTNITVSTNWNYNSGGIYQTSADDFLATAQKVLKVANAKPGVAYSWLLDGVQMGTGLEIALTNAALKSFRGGLAPGNKIEVVEANSCGQVVSDPYYVPEEVWEYWSATDSTSVQIMNDSSILSELINSLMKPSINSQPKNQAVCSGDSAVFSVSTAAYHISSWLYQKTGLQENSIDYSWYRDFQTMQTTSVSDYSIGQTSLGDVGNYSVEVKKHYTYFDHNSNMLVNGSASTTSQMASLSVFPSGLRLAQQPQGGTINEGSSYVFQVDANLPLGTSFEWFKDGAPVISDNASGANSPMLTINPVMTEDAGTYQVTISTPCQTLTSSSALLKVCHTDWNSSADTLITNLLLVSNAVVSASSQLYAATNAFDAFISTNAQTWTNCWLPATNQSSWLRVKLATPKVVEAYDVFPASPSGCFQDAGVAQVSWALQGSKDGTNWAALHFGTSASPWTNGIKRTYYFNTTNRAYAFYQITNYGVWVGTVPSTNKVGISELRLYERISNNGNSCDRVEVVNPPVNSAAPAIAVDFNSITISNTTVTTNWAIVTDSDSAWDEITLAATSTNHSVVPVVIQTTSNQMMPATNRYAVKITAPWGFYGTNTISLTASNTTPPYLASSCAFQVVIPAPTGGGTNANPTNGPALRTRLGYWRFNDTDTWREEGGLLPSATNGLLAGSSWSTKAVYVSSAQESLLEYPCRRGPAPTNAPVIAFDSGTVQFWFRPDWGGMSADGNGPGKTIRLFEAGQPESFTWILSLAEVTNRDNLFANLSFATNGVAFFIHENLGQSTQLKLNDPIAGVKDVVKDINVLLMGACIYESNRFKNVSLRTETTNLLARNPVGEDLIRLNRMLLEDAFAANIVRKPLAPTGAYPAWLSISVNSLGTMLRVEAQSGFSHYQLVSGLNAFPMHQWCQVVLTCETNAIGQTLRLYGNGRLLGSATNLFDANWIASLKNQNVFRLGCANAATLQAEGAFDELETFNFPFNADEVAANFERIMDIDTDGDGLPDVVEDGIGTNPLAMDSDCDGLPDGWEYHHRQNPADAYDWSPYAQAAYATELLRPNATNGSLPVVQIRPGRSAAYLTWDGVAVTSPNYSVYRSTNFAGSFVLVGGTGSSRTFTDSSPSLLAGQTYYYFVKCNQSIPGRGDQRGIDSEIVSVVPFGCSSNPPPRLSAVKTLKVPSVNGSYLVKFNTLLTNSILVNIGGQPLVYVVDQVVSGSLMINGAPWGPDNNVISNGASALWTPPTTIADPNTPAFRVYVSDRVQRFDYTVGVKIVVQPKRYVFGWGRNDKGQLGDGHYADNYWAHYHPSGNPNTTRDFDGPMSYFPWCNGAFKLYGYFSPANGRGYNLYGGLIVSNFATWEASNNVIPRDERWQTYTNNQWGGFMGYFANPEYRSWELMPVRVLDLPGTVRSISMGSGLRNYPNGRAFGMAEGEPEMGQFMATDEDGKLWQWGYDAYGMFGRIFSLAQTNRVFTNSIDADPNYLHNFPSQRAVAWGSETPEGWTNRGILPVIALPSAYRVPSLTNGPSQSFDDIQSVCGNAFLRLALKQDGSLWSWGDKMLIGRPQDINHPNIFTNLQFYFNWLDGVTNDVVAFIGGENYPVYDWLYNYYWWYYDQNYGGDVLPGRVNIPGNDAAGIIPGRKIVDVQSTPYASLARCQDGSIWFFGRNAYASIYETTWRPAEWSLNPYDPNSLDQLPFIERDETKPWKPVCIASLGSTNGEANPIIQTSVADGHWVFLRADGTVIEWGFVPNLVDPDYSSFWRVYNSKDPVPVQFPQGIGIASVAAANEYSVAVDENGSVWAWGLINHKHVLNPIPLPLKNISKVVCAGNTVLALDKKGSVWGWGYIGTHGLLQVPPENGGAWMVAVGRYTDRSIEPGFKTRPVRINGIENVSDIFAGGESAFAIGEKEDGKPVHLAGTGLDQGAKLVWDSYPGAGQYNVYRSLDKDSGYILIGTATQTAYVDGGPMTIPGQNALKSQPLVNGQTYYYKVSAVVNGVETAKSREAEVSPQPVPSQVPNVSLTLKCRSVVINWTVCTNADQSSPVEYRVERAKNGGDIFEPMFHYAPEWGTNVVTMQYEDSEITTNTHYAYRVIAVNDAGQSLPSNILTVDTADGNCTEAPQMIPPGQAYFRRIQHYNNGGSSSDDSDGGILLGDGADSSSGGGGSSTGGGSGVDFTDTFGEAQLTWTYSVNDSTNITAFRFRYHYAEQGHQKVAEYVQNVAVTDVTLDSSDNLFKHYRYNLRILPQKQCTITVSAIRNGEESRSSDSVTVVADDSNWSEKTRLRAVPGYQQVYLDWPDSDLIYSYDVLCTAWPLWEPPWSGSGIGVDSLNVDNSVTIGKDLLDTRVWHTGLSSSNITTADIMSLRDLTARLTDTNDLVGQWLWNQFAPTSQRIVTNYQAHAGSWADAGIVATKQLVVDQLNAMIQGGVILLTPAQLTQLNLSTNGDFSLRTRQDMQRQALATIANPFTANDVAELNRYMLEDLFAGQIARMGEPMVGEYVSAEIAPNSISDVWSLLTLLTNTNNSNAVAISNAMHSVVDLENYSEPVWPNPFDPVEYRATTVAMRNVMARGLTAAIQNTNLDLDCDAVTNRFTSRTLNLYVNRTNLDVNARSLMNRLILQELGDWGWFFAPMTGQRYYVLVGNTYDGGNFKNPYWVAAQPSKTASPPQALSLNAQTFPYSSMVLVQWYIPGKTNYVVGSGTNWQFYVERKSGSDPYSLLAAAGFGLSYLDQDVVNDTTYTYRVTAMDQDYNRLQAEVSGTPTYSSALTLLPPVAGNGYVNLAWTPVRAASFTVQHSLDQVNFDSVGILNNGDAYKNADSHFRHVPVQNGVQHYYRIQGLTPTGIKFYSDVKSAVPLATLPPLPPDEFNVSLTLSPDGVGARAMFTWTPKSGADHYQVFVRQGGALTPIYDGRAMYCSYDIPLNTPDDTTLLFDIRCVTADNQYGETKEITCKYSKWEIDAKSGETPPLQLVVAGTLSQAFTNDVIGPTNLTLGVVTSLKLKRISFYDQREDGRHLIGQADSEPFVFNWMQPKGGNHYVTASAEVLMGDNPASGTAPVALMNSDPAVFRLIIKPELAAYTASATDLQLPGLGMPISIGRSYSSHGTGTNLLGVGWSPNWNGGKITFSTPLAAGWIGSTGMFLGQVTMYSVGSDTNHEASVNLPSGESVPFWIGIDGQTQNNPINGGVNSINAKLIFGNYDSIGGTLTGNGSSQVDVVAAMASGTEWIKAPLTLHDSSWDDWGGTPSPGADLIAFGAFTYTSSDNTQYLYDRPVGTDGLSWLLTSITDRNGNSLHYVYGDGTTTAKPLDQIIAITNSCGRGVKFRYDSGVGYTNIIVSDAFGDDVLKYCVTNCQLRAVWRRTERPTVPPNPNPNPWEITRYNYGTSVDDTNRIVEAYDQRGVRVVANSYMSATNEETAGNLFRQTNIANSVTTYNLSNYVLTVVQTVGGVSKVIKVVNDDSGAIVGVTTPVIGTNAPTALTVTNTYDERGRLIAQRDALGGLKTFSYDAQDHLTGQSDANGNSTSSEVNSFGEPTTSTDANGNVATSQYDDAGNPTKVTDPSGTVTISEYSDLFTATSGKVLGRRLHRELRNAPGVPYTLVTIYSYIGEADSEASSPAFGDVKSTTEEWGLADDVNNVSVVGTPVTVTYQYDANGNRTNEIKTRLLASGTETISSQSRYDAANRVLASQVKSSIGGILQTSGVVFNPLGKQSVSADGAGRTTASTYDYAGNLIETLYPDGTVSRTAYTLDGHPEWVQDRTMSGTTTVAPGTKTTYDASGRAVKVERYASMTMTSNSATAGMDYFGPANLPKMTASFSGAALTTTRTFYDELGRVPYKVDARGNVTAKVFDAGGRVTNTLTYVQVSGISDTTAVADITLALSTNAPVQSTSYGFDANGNQTVVTDALGHSITNVYDKANRVVETDYPDTGLGKRARFTRYNGLGQRVQETDENGVITKYTYDFRGLLTSVTLAAETDKATTTTYAYDELGNEVSQRDANNHATTFAYDALGRRISRTLPDGQKEGYGYDNVKLTGNLLYQTNFNGVVITNQYDFASGRLTNCSAPGYVALYTYNPTNGLRTQMGDRSGFSFYDYDTLGRLARVRKVWPNPAGIGFNVLRSINYGYDQLGSLTNMWADGFTNVYRYDALGRLTNVLADSVSAAGYNYDAVGNLQGMSYGNGAGAAYQYDARNRLTNLVWNLGANPLAAFGYAVNATGQRTASTETVSGTSRSYQWSYDQLSRLTNEVISGSGTVGYTFDAVGNRKSRTSTVAQVLGMNSSFTPNDWLASDGYDANGNTTNSASNVYQYDVMNRLTNAVVNGNTIQLTYDGDGNRVKKVVNGVITRYLVDDRNPSGYAQVVEEFTGLTLSKVYTYGLALISQRQVSSGAVNYYGTDGHGSTRFLMDTSGNVTDTYAYDAYGILTAKTGTTPNNYLYCCQQWDSDLGMYYLRARYLNPNTGRFWSRDLCDGTEIAPSSLHKYLYCQNNPIDMIDPSGFWGTIPKFPVHQMAIDDELSFLPESDRKILRDEQVNVDKHQDASESYMHAMRDGEHYQSVTSAKNEANSFVRQHINMARLFQNRGNREKAMSELGQAIHTLQDSTSPSHHGFKPWYNYFLGEYDPNEWVHAGREGINPGPGSWLYKATRRGYDYFNNRVPLTSNIDFFDKLGGDGVVDEVIGAAKRAARNATHYQAPSIMLQMSVFGSFGY